MKKQDGKLNITNLILIIVIFYGGYAGIKLLSASLMESQIENEIVDMFGVYRGPDFTEEMAREQIRKILLKNDIIFEEKDDNAVEVEIDTKAGKIFYYFKYEIETDLLFFKKRKTVEVEEEVRSYG
ncbi:MAG: hypothetical protein GY950_15650 [bacterium]|nr:hypothetical protein [bacterium]